MSDSSAQSSSPKSVGAISRPIQVIVVSSVLLTFISYWRTAAIVLCDLASTAYYIGGIVENAIGPAAPWFILAVMIFSYAVRSIYIESCALFVRGGVYRVVKEAMGGFLAKLSVSALMFDFIITGPISGVSAGQYIIGLILDTLGIINPELQFSPESSSAIRHWGAVIIACLITLYFFRQNLLGIHESSGKALKIMITTTIMAVIIWIWCGITLLVQGPVNKIPFEPDLSPKVEYEVITGVDRVTHEEKEMWKIDPQTRQLVPEMVKDRHGNLIAKPKINKATNAQEDPLGFLASWFPDFSAKLRQPGNWLSMIGVVGLLIAFGHSILAMSGEETLAQVYREVQSPKMPNFKKAAFIVFVYSLGLTATISFLAVLLIPDEIRMKDYSGNLISGLSMYVIGPQLAKLILNSFVVMVGFLILSGAVNTSIIGSNGVLNRVAEDGVMPDWFLKPHRRYGTTYRMLYLIVGMQLITIILSQGNMYTLGEAYAFGVVWSFVFNALAMLVLRFKDPSPREFKVPLNVRIGKLELPVGIGIVFLILLITAILNLLTKEEATIGGIIFTMAFLIMFTTSEHIHKKRLGKSKHQHLDQFNQQTSDEVAPAVMGIKKPYCKLVAIRSTQNLFMLEKTLAETDPDTTDVAVMTAQLTTRGDTSTAGPDLDQYNRTLMTAVVNRAEKAGKQVHPLIIRTNNPLYAVVHTAKDLNVQELILGASNTYMADEQIEQIAFYWISMHGGEPSPLTVRILSRNRDLYFDLAGGNRIPKIGERKARSVAELREAGIGVRHVMLIHFNTSASSDLFSAALTMLDPLVGLTVVPVPIGANHTSETDWLQQDLQRAEQLRREVEVCPLPAGDPVENIVKLLRKLQCDLLIVGEMDVSQPNLSAVLDYRAIVCNSPCQVSLISVAAIPHEVEG
jgi:amino acid transporter/nucleotide-binding universal stress UspA family protein